MKGFLKRRLPAFLLALILAVGTMPAAMATETTDTECTHVWDTAWSRDSSRHWHECTLCGEKDVQEHHEFSETSRKEPSCFEEGKVTSACTACGYETEQILSATEDHDFADSWSGDNENHWHACSNSGAGCTATADTASHTPHDEGIVTDPTCTTAGKITYTCEICGRTYTRPGTAALGHSLDSTGKCTRSGCSYQETTSYTVTFKTGADTITESVRVGASPTMSKVASKPTYSATNKTYTFKGWIEGTTSTYAYTGQTLVTPTSASITKNTTFSAVYTVSATKQAVSLDVDKDTSGTKVGPALRTGINNAVKAVTGVSFDNVKFSGISSSTYGKLYTSSSESTAISSGTTYSYSDVYSFYFVPTSKDTFTMSYTATAGSNTVAGTVTLNVGSSSDDGTTIKYSVEAGSYVDFDRADFKAVCDAELSGTFRYVKFTTSSTLSSSAGAVYADYGTSDQKYFTKSTIDDYKYYYSSSAYGDYALNSLSYVAPDDADERTVTLSYKVYDSTGDYVSGTVEIEVVGSDGSSSGSGTTIKYSVEAGSYVDFDRADFKAAYDAKLDGTVRYVTLSTSDTISSSVGGVYYNYGESDQKVFSKSTIDNYEYYYSSSSYGDYALSKLSFVVPDDAEDRIVELTYTVYDSAGDSVTGTVEITVGDAASSDSAGTITYQVEAGDSVSFDRADFNAVFQTKYTGTIRYVTFSTSDTLSTSKGTVYYDYDGTGEKYFSKSTIDDFKFYYSSSSYGDYALNELSFVAGSSFSEKIELSFTAYYTSTKYVEGTLVIKPKDDSASLKGDILYYTAYTDKVQINAHDIARYLQETYPSYGLQYVKLTGVPSTGALYYNYYGTSSYGTTSKLKLTTSNCDDQNFYFSPSAATQYALTELTYVPSGQNYCVTIPFTAYASSSRNVSGTILISVNLSAVPEVYGVTTKGTAVSMPTSAIYSAVAQATGVQLAGIQFLELPASTVGTMYVGSGTSLKANTTTQYGYSSGTYKMSQLRFVPATGYTGSVEIPYLAYNSAGKVIASGKFCLGVVSSIKKFSDMTASTWCYKYVIELNDAGVIAGYKDGTFQQARNVSYGEALKLIMLAAGYDEQAKTSTHWASGYLSKAKADGLISGTVNLDAPITRLAVAQIAAKALKLDTTNLSSIKPFTDTSDVYVQTLNAAGIVEGYFSNGTSTYKGGNYLTRGHISAIVWRMERSK